MGLEYSPSADTVKHLTFNDRIARYDVRRWALLTFFLPCNGCELVIQTHNTEHTCEGAFGGELEGAFYPGR